MMAYGFICFSCRESINFDDLSTIRSKDECGVSISRQAYNRAGALGWCIGHYNGQGLIVYPNCTTEIFDALPLGETAQPEGK